MLGGSCLASSIELHCGLTAPDVHQVQSATASQEVLSLLSWQVAVGAQKLFECCLNFLPSLTDGISSISGISIVCCSVW